MAAYDAIISDLQARANPAKAKILSGFFKTGKGQYGEGDVFLGIVVPKQREVVKKYWKEASLQDIEKLLVSKIHEYRLVALLILVQKYNQAQKQDDESACKLIFDFYLAHTSHINNWDLVDLSAPNIAGRYLQMRKEQKPILLKMAKSKHLWERRIAILATFEFIRNKSYVEILQLAKLLLNDKHDLIHKAAGWMLREMGKRGGEKELHAFLQANAAKMPRTMLRYAIERLGKEERRRYMQIKSFSVVGRYV